MRAKRDSPQQQGSDDGKRPMGGDRPDDQDTQEARSGELDRAAIAGSRDVSGPQVFAFVAYYPGVFFAILLFFARLVSFAVKKHLARFLAHPFPASSVVRFFVA
jgi:hypothetical protein